MSTASAEAPASFSALVVDDDPGVRQSLRLCLEGMGGRVLGVGTAGAALDATERSPFDVVLLDLWLGATSGLDALPQLLRRRPDAGVIVITAFATFESAVKAIQQGAMDYLPKPFTPDQVRMAVQRVLDTRRLRARVIELEERVADADTPAWFESESPTYRAFLETARRAASSDAVVLLRGESGTGKTVLAQWLRANGPRRDRPFVRLHCPSADEASFTARLFGSARPGDLTPDVPGKLDEAEGGTLLLDEIGDLGLVDQTRLLRFLHDRTYERLGETHSRRSDVRLMVATHQPLEELVRRDAFREDLFFRLNVVSLSVPPLRERGEDIVRLAQHYLQHVAARQGRRREAFSAEAVEAMRRHPWPGNLRELRNAVERAAILGGSDVLTADALGLGARSAAGPEVGALVSLEELEREHLARVVLRTPTLEAAARVLGIDATTLQRKRKKYGLT
nr:sigma-54-dependent Fis family transcriptional regulator [Deltaproteobacteria bacterium]